MAFMVFMTMSALWVTGESWYYFFCFFFAFFSAMIVLASRSMELVSPM